MSAALLLAEPEHETRSYLEHHLRCDGFDVVGVDAGRDARELLERARPDLVLLGADLADEPGLEVCRRLRAGEPGRSWNREVPVIVLGEEHADATDRVRAFDGGCDDVVDRPFAYEELRARIRAVLRRSARAEGDGEVIDARGLVVDRRTRTVRAAGRRVDLSTKEFELLLALASDPERVFTKDELLREVWGFRSLVRTRTVDSHASRVRRKLAAVSDTPYVVNVWGIGYRLLLPN